MANATEFAAGRYIPFVGIVDPDGIKDVAVADDARVSAPAPVNVAELVVPP